MAKQPSEISDQALHESIQLIQETKGLPDYLWIETREHSHFQTTTPTASETPMKDQSLLLTKAEQLLQLRERMGDCQRCRLGQTRTQLVFGTGDPEAQLMFVGEGPGADEDRTGEPFVGRAGQLLTKIIQAMGLQREQVYIANVVKSRPPDNRTPAPDEIESCSPFLFEQIKIVQPKVIVCLGSVAAQTLLATKKSMGALRGKLQSWPTALISETLQLKLPIEAIQLMATYHPAYLLRNPEMKKPVWEDMKLVMQVLNLQLPATTTSSV